MLSRAPAKHQSVQQGICAKSVAAVDADTRHFARGVESRHRCLAINVGFDSAHLIVHSRLNWDRFLRDVDISEVSGDFLNLG